METLFSQELLGTQIAAGVTLGDLLTVDFVTATLGNLLSAIVILLIGYAFAGWATRRIRWIGTKHASLDQTLFNFLGSLARYAILAVVVIFVLNRFGLQTTSLVAALGAAGLAIGLALQGTLSNVAAGVMLIVFRPIKTGDFVVVNGQMGTVKEISLNYTEMASVGNVQIIIPNSAVWGNTITNYSAYPKRRAEWTFGVSFETDLALAEKTIRETIMADPRSQTDPEPFIQVNSLSDSSVDFLVRVWCDASVYFGYQTDMTRAVKEALDKAGISIPFPTRMVISPKG